MDKLITQVLPELLLKGEVIRQVLEAAGFDHDRKAVREVNHSRGISRIWWSWIWEKQTLKLYVDLCAEGVEKEDASISLVLGVEDIICLIAVIYDCEATGWIIETDGVEEFDDSGSAERHLCALHAQLPSHLQNSDRAPLTEAEARDIMSQMVSCFMKFTADPPTEAPPTP